MALPHELRFVVADGATEAWESGPWAEHLAQAYARQPPTPADFPEWLATTQRTWKPSRNEGPVPWYAEIKQEEGSFATLAGIEFRFNKETARWAWKAVAIGDSCLFQVRGVCLHQAFPISTRDGFGSRPHLVPSTPSTTCPEPEWLAGLGQPLDLFLLATDAVAAYLLSLASEDWPEVIATIDEGLLSSEAAPLQDWLQPIQTAKNDDLTLIAIQIPRTSEASE